MKTEHLLDIIFCIILLPGMMFLFPVTEWLQWHAGYVAIYVLWVYFVWFLCRKLLGPQLRQGWRGGLTTVLALFLLASATFLMTLTPVDFPQPEAEIGKMELHVRAMWVFFFTAVANGLPVGLLRSQVKELSEQKEGDESARKALNALESSRAQADTGEEIQVKAGDKTVHIPLSAIRYIQGRNNYACFCLDHREDVVSQIPLKEVLEQLPEGKFVRIHRSYIVPVWRIVKSTSTQVQLMGLKEPLPVGRTYKDNLKNNG